MLRGGDELLIFGWVWGIGRCESEQNNVFTVNTRVW